MTASARPTAAGRLALEAKGWEYLWSEAVATPCDRYFTSRRMHSFRNPAGQVVKFSTLDLRAQAQPSAPLP